MIRIKWFFSSLARKLTETFIVVALAMAMKITIVADYENM